MGKIEDDKYQDREEKNSQVRNIINQLNADKPAQEKSREVVTRADGTKVVRVTKKRKVVVSKEEKNRRSRKGFVYSILVGVLVLACLVGIFAFRVSMMSGEAYFNEASQKLQQAYGAKSVRLIGARLDGFTLCVDNVLVDFGEESPLELVEMSDVSGSLATSSFFTGILRVDELKLGRVAMTFRSGVQNLQIPQWQGEELWKFSRVNCADFSCYVGSDGNHPVALEHATAYMYFPGRSKESRILILKGGRLQLRGWKPMELSEGRLTVTPVALENIRLAATTDISREKGAEPASYMIISGRIAQGESLTSPLAVDSENMSFSEFSSDKFTQFLNAKTKLTASGKNKPTVEMVLPFDTQRPVFSGHFSLTDVRFTFMPAVLTMLEHIEPVRRRSYMPLQVKSGKVHLTHAEDGVTLSFQGEDMQAPDIIILRGNISVNAANELSGTLDYGIPSSLTHVEYPDGMADPIFRDDGITAWVSTKLSGYVNAPKDNSAELEQQAEPARADRPRRTPFDTIDVDALSDQVLGTKHTESNANLAKKRTEEPGEASEEPSGTVNPFAPKNTNPFEPSNPFETNPSNPFGTGTSNPFDTGSTGGDLLGPADKSIFPSK